MTAATIGHVPCPIFSSYSCAQLVLATCLLLLLLEQFANPLSFLQMVLKPEGISAHLSESEERVGFFSIIIGLAHCEFKFH